jgi:hypothetical protein
MSFNFNCSIAARALTRLNSESGISKVVFTFPYFHKSSFLAIDFVVFARHSKSLHGLKVLPVEALIVLS